MRRLWILPAGLFLATIASAQDCRVKIAVAYTDGTKTEVGLTAEQQKFWDREAAKHFPGFCLDPKDPNYLIL